MTDRNFQTGIFILCFAMVSIVGAAWVARSVDAMLEAEIAEICHRSNNAINCPPRCPDNLMGAGLTPAP